MCGVSGIYNYSGKKVDETYIKLMRDSLNHRGPDAYSHYLDGCVALGHNRLKIIDLNTGDQPLSNEDKSIWIIFNGEIYNYKEYRKILTSKGYNFRTNTDTEVIV